MSDFLVLAEGDGPEHEAQVLDGDWGDDRVISGRSTMSPPADSVVQGMLLFVHGRADTRPFGMSILRAMAAMTSRFCKPGWVAFLMVVSHGEN